MAGGDEHELASPLPSRVIYRIALTSVAAAAAETATFPIDAVKTRLQLRRPGEPLFAGGVLRLYSGVTVGVVRHLFYTPLRIVGYEHLRSYVSGDGNTTSFIGKAVVGGISGVVAQVVASPADLVKVRMQADARLLGHGHQPRYYDVADAFAKIIRKEGFLRLWTGVVPNAQRAFLVNMGELTCYDHAKHFVIRSQICQDNVYAHMLASVASGLAATAFSCPADVIKTRMMNQASGDSGVGGRGKALYTSSYDCLIRTVKQGGVGALWKGFLPTWARLGPWQFVFWVSYERLREVSGLSSF